MFLRCDTYFIGVQSTYVLLLAVHRFFDFVIMSMLMSSFVIGVFPWYLYFRKCTRIFCLLCFRWLHLYADI